MVYPQGPFFVRSDDRSDPAGGGAQSESGVGAPGVMAPLDSRNSETYAPPAWDDAPVISLNDAPTLGEGLKAARESSGRTLEQLADLTRVRQEYLRAIEQNAWTSLPSRPFTLGYVRAYARVLGLDEQAAGDRFKAEFPDESSKLQAPVGSELQDVKRRSPILVAVVGLVIAGVVAWNVTQRIVSAERAAPSDLSETPGTWKQGQPLAVIPVSAPLPAPPDQTVPAPYITPGLDPEAQAAGAAEAAAPVPPGPAIPVGAAFNPKGAVYGSAPNGSSVTLQARKPANIVVRNADGSVVYFARQLATGEAWRAPAGANMVIDVSEPLAFAVYLNGEYHGSLDAALTQVTRLNAMAAKSAADAARSAAAASAAQNAATPAAFSGPEPNAEPQAPPAAPSPAAG